MREIQKTGYGLRVGENPMSAETIVG